MARASCPCQSCAGDHDRPHVGRLPVLLHAPQALRSGESSRSKPHCLALGQSGLASELLAWDGTTELTGQPGLCDGGGSTFGIMGLFLVLMWFMVLRPESKRRKETQNMLSLLKQGDTVVTIGGMHGVVHSLDEKTVILMVDNVRMAFDRSAIARVVRDEQAAAAGGSDTPAKS